MYQVSYYHPNSEIQEYLHELTEDGFSKDYTSLHFHSRMFLAKINTLYGLDIIDFIDFYETLDDELKSKIQFSSALKKTMEHVFSVHKSERGNVIADELDKMLDRLNQTKNLTVYGKGN